jgi:hypothetical protein
MAASWQTKRIYPDHFDLPFLFAQTIQTRKGGDLRHNKINKLQLSE